MSRSSGKIYVQVKFRVKYMFKDRIYGTKYSRIDQVKFVEDSL